MLFQLPEINFIFMQKQVAYIFTTLLLLYFNILRSTANDSIRQPKSIYLEALGIGGYGSLNYEHQLIERSFTRLRLRAGISTYHLKDYEEKFNPDILIPTSCYVLIGNKHFAEIGTGATISSTIEANKLFLKKRNWNFHTSISLGYRYEHNRFLFRLTYSPLQEAQGDWRNWAGISFGYIVR